MGTQTFLRFRGTFNQHLTFSYMLAQGLRRSSYQLIDISNRQSFSTINRKTQYGTYNALTRVLPFDLHRLRIYIALNRLHVKTCSRFLSRERQICNLRMYSTNYSDDGTQPATTHFGFTTVPEDQKVEKGIYLVS